MQVGISALLIFLYIAGSSSGDAMLILMLPFFLGIPGGLVILIVFVPIEFALQHRPLWISLIAIPLAGAAVPWLVVPVLSPAKNAVDATWMISEIGLAWGILWAITRLFFKRTDLAQANR